MLSITWTVRRYKLPSYDKRALATAIQSWVKKRKGRVQTQHLLALFGKTTQTDYRVAPPGLLGLIGKEDPNLIVCYESQVLYTYTRANFPPVLADINEAVVTPYVTQRGGAPFRERPYTLEKGLLTLGRVHSAFLSGLEESTSPTAPSRPAPAQPDVRIHLKPNLDQVQTASEEISVPPGVTITVRRSRTVEHVVDVNWRVSASGGIEVGLRPLISASILGEIEQERGRAYQQSETVEYEVELEGRAGTRYRLTWTDMWRRGVVELWQGNTTQTLPFRFREWVKLDVSPIGTTDSI